MTTKIKAIGINTYGSADVLEQVTIDKPTQLGDHDVLVKVQAFAVNPVDYKIRSQDPKTKIENPPRILGWDAAGVVEKVGAKAHKFKVGDEIYFTGDFTKNGSYAEYTVVDERIAAKRPKKLSATESAAIPLVALTAWEGLFEQLEIPTDPKKNAGKSILIINGAGGVGSLVIQLAKKIAGLQVLATASRPESVDFVKKLGADYVIDHKKDIEKQIKEIKGLENGVDYVYNAYTTETYFSQIPNFLKPLGKVVFITAEPFTNPPPLHLYFTKRLHITFEMMFSRTLLNVEPEKHGEILEKVAQLFDDGVLKSVLTQTFKPSEIKQVHKILEEGKAIGKIALQW